MTGADWIVVQYDMNCQPKMAWLLRGTGITNEGYSDGIYWYDPAGHLIHISGWYNRIQVKGEQFEAAAKLLGVDVNLIQNGKYPREGKVGDSGGN